MFLKNSNFNVDLKSVLTTEYVEKDVASDAKMSKTYSWVFVVFAIF
jgi:hypothetical protein